MGFTVRSVRFENEGQQLAATLYVPESISAKVPAILLCHGFCGVKELLLPTFAEFFAEKGFVAMTFDYRGFGESEGEPGRLVPALQVSDIRAALTCLSSQPEVDADRLGLWGTSFGGANVIVAASQDERVKALAVQITFGDGERVITGRMDEEEKTRFLEMLTKLKDKREATGKEMMVSLPKVLSDAQSRAFYEDYHERFPALDIKIPFLTTLETLGHKPERVLDQVKVPIHFTGARQDGVNPPAEMQSLFDQATGTKELLWCDATHYDIYEGKPFVQVASAQAAWFGKYL